VPLKAGTGKIVEMILPYWFDHPEKFSSKGFALL